MTPKAAVSALRRLPLFERVSLRLLQDLVEFASLETWWEESDDRPPGDRSPARTPFLHERRGGGPLSERRFEGRWLHDALRSSFTLARAFPDHSALFEVLAPDERPGGPGPMEEPPALHWLFLTKDAQFVESDSGDVDLDLETAAALLARALARTSAGTGEGAAVATLGAQGVRLEGWDGKGSLGVVDLPAAQLGGWAAGAAGFPSSQIAGACRTLGPVGATAWHVVCIVPTDPQALPGWWTEKFGRHGFHRIVYLTRNGRRLRPPKQILRLLCPGAWDARRNDGPYFSSVVPTVVLGDPPHRWCPTWTEVARDLPTLEVRPWDDFDYGDVRPESGTIDARLQRDLCRIRIDPHRAAVADDDRDGRASLDRWARALTNRQVGLALSGGGATSAALVPFIERLQASDVPIDVIGSFSGGAILGLYLAAGQLGRYYDALHRNVFSALVPASFFWSKWLQVWINLEFGNACLSDLDVRFVPMTVELPGDGSPRACAVVGGSLGEAVRVSGIGLGLVGPAERRGTRYVDGGVAFGVPAAVLPFFGADMVIGCNSIVPPRGRDLNAFLPVDIGRLLQLNPLVDIVWDRMSDVIVGMLTTLRQSARQGAEDADVYYEVSADETPFLASFFWVLLDRIREAAAHGRGWEEPLSRTLEQWRRLRGVESP